MSEVFLDGKVKLHQGDSRDVLGTLGDASIDSVVTDPPYALVSIGKRFGKPGAAPAKHGTDGLYARASAGFMGQSWDTGETAFAANFWAEVLRALKPGGHLVAFSGTRTYHRMACAIEDAGFEIRDQLAWVYGNGFPKSHDVSKAIDRAAGVARIVVGRETLTNDIHGGALLDAVHDGRRGALERDVTIATSERARQWDGWGTALKPAWEPIVLARKPLCGTVAETVIEHGTGALNIGGCRIESDGGRARTGEPSQDRRYADHGATDFAALPGPRGGSPFGRWPANIITDGSDEVLAAFPAAPGQLRTVGPHNGAKTSVHCYGSFGPREDFAPRSDCGSAARFFYSAKADANDRIGSKHPTVKPVDLMQWLCRLVTPPGGVVLDPFAGTGTTGEAAWREGLSAILIEREAAYCDDIRRRMALCLAGHDERVREALKARGNVGAVTDLPLFGSVEAAE